MPLCAPTDRLGPASGAERVPASEGVRDKMLATHTNNDEPKPHGGWVRKVGRAIRAAWRVDSPSKAVRLLHVTIPAGVTGIAGLVLNEAPGTSMVLLFLAAAFGSPVLIWVVRRVWGRIVRLDKSRDAIARASRAETELREAQGELREAKYEQAQLAAKLDAAVHDRDEDRRIATLAADMTNDARRDRLLTSPDPNYEIERWLDDVKPIIRVLYDLPAPEDGAIERPESRVGVGVFRFVDGHYELVYDAGVPPAIAALCPVKARRGFIDCLRSHWPNADAKPFQVDGEDHWLAVFPPQVFTSHAGLPSHPAHDRVLEMFAERLGTWVLLIRRTPA